MTPARLSRTPGTIRKLGDIRGAFVEGLFDVTECFSDHNVLAVKIYPPYNPGIPHEQSKAAGRGPNGGQLCLDGPTFISSEGWDWIPGIRDRNIGIWQDVTLAYTGDVTLAYPQVVTDLPLPDTSSADVTVRMEMTNHAAVGRHVVLCGRRCPHRWPTTGPPIGTAAPPPDSAAPDCPPPTAPGT